MTDTQYTQALAEYRTWEQAARAAILAEYQRCGKLPKEATWSDAEELMVAEMER